MLNFLNLNTAKITQNILTNGTVSSKNNVEL